MPDVLRARLKDAFDGRMYWPTILNFFGVYTTMPVPTRQQFLPQAIVLRMAYCAYCLLFTAFILEVVCNVPVTRIE